MQGKWIWENAQAKQDEHAEFFTRFSYQKTQGALKLLVSVDTDYGVYINGKFVDFGQYVDYPYYKVYDEIDITNYVQDGENTLAFEVWYAGRKKRACFMANAGLFFEVLAQDSVIACSGEKTQSRLSKTYANHRGKYVTSFIGFTYAYDATKEDDWTAIGGVDFTDSAVDENRERPKIVRPVKKLITGAPIKGKLIKREGNRYLFDFGRELAGVYRLKCISNAEQSVTLSYGEHIADGWVRRKIYNYDFSFDYKAKAGVNDYFGYCCRLGLRYMEITAETALENLEIELYSRDYPLKEKPFQTKDKDLQAIYDVCKETLKLCMHEHYEDCPWREQGQYVMDSRNQMLCGYYAFDEYVFARECIRLFALDKRDDNLLSIRVPADPAETVIISFNLHFYTQVREYGDYANDWAFVSEIYPKLQSVLQVFIDHYKTQGRGKLLPILVAPNYWNFYEWTSGLSGGEKGKEPMRYDVVLNCLFSLALQNMAYICKKIDKPHKEYETIAKNLNEQIHKTFFDNHGGYSMYGDGGHYSELGNALAVLCGAGDACAKQIAQTLASENDWVQISLSMKCFLYDALLKVDKTKYRAYVLDDIKRVYSKMLKQGATAFWETELGEKDFGGAGSLCHGWSAIALYYMHILDA